MKCLHYIFLANVLASGLQVQKLCLMVQQVMENLDPYQLVIFINSKESSYSFHHDIVMNKLLQNIPAITIDIVNFQLYSDDELFTLPIFKDNGEKTVVYVLLHDNLGSNADNMRPSEVNKELDFIASLSPVTVRPKCLALFLESKDIQKEKLREMVKQAWLKKFLHFTIAEINTENNSLYLFNFNPFFNTFSRKLLDSNISFPIFPEKLSNANKFLINLPIFQYSSFYKTMRNQFGSINDDGINKSLVILALQKLNFGINFIKVNNHNNTMFAEILKKSIEQLKNGSIHLIIAPLLTGVFKNFSEIELGYNCEPVVALVPVVQKSTLNIAIDVYIYVFIIPISVILMISGLNYFRIQKRDFSFFDVFKILFGIPLNNYPKNISDRLIVLSIIIVSFQYSSDFYSKAVEIRLLRDEIPFDNFQEIDESSFDIYINRIYFNRTFMSDDEDKHVLSIMRKIKSIDDSAVCMEKLLKYKNCICVTMSSLAAAFAEAHFDSSGYPIAKVARPVFSCQKLIFVSEQAFPYANKIHNTFLKIHSSGILRDEIYKQDLIKYKIQKQSCNMVVFNIELLSILLCGYLLSAITFFMELFLDSMIIKNILKRQKEKCTKVINIHNL